jgi:hypothetical protein
VVLELEVVQHEEAASVVEEADVVQHKQVDKQEHWGGTLEQLVDTCFEEIRCGASEKMCPKMSPPHGCVWSLPYASLNQSQL